MGYSSEKAEAIVQMVLTSNKTQREIAEETGVGLSSIQRWLRLHREYGVMNVPKNEKRPQDWTAEERFAALMETCQMTDDEKAAWCRKNGLHTHHIEQWKKDAVTGTSPKPNDKKRGEERRLRQEIKQLKKELTRKEKALAETAALLVLKKKAQSIWGEPEDD